jgi:hypothetical protein
MNSDSWRHLVTVVLYGVICCTNLLDSVPRALDFAARHKRPDMPVAKHREALRLALRTALASDEKLSALVPLDRSEAEVREFLSAVLNALSA